MSKQAQHTPGPWTATVDFILGERRYLLSSQGRNFGDFRGWAEYGITTPEEDHYNARLIAAAPELLAALKEVYELCGEVLKRQPNAGEYAHNMAVGLRGKVSTAIKRAEGEG